MTHYVKFENLESELVNLPEVFKNSIQNEFLTIKKIDKQSDKFKRVCTSGCDLQKAEYVIFSSYMGKEYHELETFIFLDSSGSIVCNLSGRELDLYNMITDCDNLVESEEYIYNK